MVLTLGMHKDLSAQAAQFETSFFFEDSSGNRDTIIIGADPSADELINTHLGESVLTQPWDNVFEVRVTTENIFHNHSWFQDPLYLFNKKITHFIDLDECGYSTSVIFLFYTEHFPVTVTWDTVVWSIHASECYLDGSFFHHSNEIFEPGWWTSFDWHYSCLGYLTFYQFDTFHTDPYVGIMDSVINTGERFIYGLQLSTNELENPISPCQYVLDVEDPATLVNPLFQIYPNPANDFISIHSLSAITTIAYVSIFNTQGMEIQRSRFLDNSPIRLEAHTPGLYFIVMKDDQSRIVATQRFVIASND